MNGRWMRRGLAGAALTLTALCALVPTGSAELDGPCQALVDGHDVNGLGTSPSDAIDVDPDAAVPYSFSGDSAVINYDAHVSYGPYTGVVDQGVSDEGSTTSEGTMDIGQFSSFGVGLYKVDAHATLADGSTCSASFLVNVEGGVLSSSVGQAATALAVLAGGGLVAISVMTASGVKTILASISVTL